MPLVNLVGLKFLILMKDVWNKNLQELDKNMKYIVNSDDYEIMEKELKLFHWLLDRMKEGWEIEYNKNQDQWMIKSNRSVFAIRAYADEPILCIERSMEVKETGKITK